MRPPRPPAVPHRPTPAPQRDRGTGRARVPRTAAAVPARGIRRRVEPHRGIRGAAAPARKTRRGVEGHRGIRRAVEPHRGICGAAAPARDREGR